MITGASLTVTYGHLTSFYKKNENNLGMSLLRLASGRRVEQPSDNIPDYFNAARLKQSDSLHEDVQSKLNEALARTEIAETVGTYVFDDLTSARNLIDSYYDVTTTEEEKEAIKVEFSQILQQVSSVLNNTWLDGKLVIGVSGDTPFARAPINPSNPDETLALYFTDSQTPDIDGLTLGTATYETESAALQAELNKAASFVAKVSVYRRSVNAFININERSRQAGQTIYSGITACDTGMEMIRAMNLSIKNQSSLTMMAQANLSRASVLRLVS
jgi:flagellin